MHGRRCLQALNVLKHFQFRIFQIFRRCLEACTNAWYALLLDSNGSAGNDFVNPYHTHFVGAGYNRNHYHYFYSRCLTEHLAIHKLTLVQYHNVFGPAIQRQLVKEKESNRKILPKKEKNGKAEKDQKTPKDGIVTKDKEEKKDIIAIAASPQSKSRRQPLKKFECNICKEDFVWKEPNISDHLQQKHNLTKEFYFNLYVKGAENSEDKFNCDTCMFNSTRKSALTFHVDKYHTAIEKRTCCEKGFKTKWDLFVHLIENHKNDKELFAKMDIWQSLEKYYLKPST